VIIHTVGVLRVLSPDGQDLTPIGARPRALLAVIALSPRKVSARRWLENLFWGDRAAPQASGSLRQALAAIRRSLGPYADVLQSNRQEIALDVSQVQIDLDALNKGALASIRSGVQVLEGLDVPTDTFEDWLRRIRNTWENTAGEGDPEHATDLSLTSLDSDESPHSSSLLGLMHHSTAPQPILLTETRSSGLQMEPFFAEAIGAQISRTATEHVNVSVISIDGQPVRAITAPGGRCTVRVTTNNNRMLVLANLARMPSSETVWSRQISFDARDELEAIDAAASLSLEATEAFANNIDGASNASLANGLAMSALQHVFSFDPDRMLQADKLLKQAQELDPHAPRPALRALAKAFHSIECSVSDIGELREEARLLVQEAMKLDDNNALALAFLADVQDLVLNDSQMALSFAERALQIDPGVGYAHASLGGLELKRGRNQSAFRSAGRARRQLENTSLQVFSNMRFCLAAMNVGDFDAAQLAAERASLLAPTSRPPLRHLYVLRLHSGDNEGAQDALVALRKLEPDFSLTRIREEAEYPADTIRRVGLDVLIDVDR
jgi:tetratricopeptide (TPR) repeat protein